MTLRRLGLLLALLTVWLTCATAFAADLTVHFFDVGQGDAALIVSPAGKTVLIDAGPPEAGEKLARRLKSLIAGPIDLMMMTHPHADHLGGMERVLNALGARIFMEPGFDHPSPLYSQLLRALESQEVPLKVGEAGRNVELGGGATLRLLAPGKPFFKGTRSDVNANSIVARLTYGTTSFYFAADSEQETEKWILGSGEELKADVYKVAHHASRHSSFAEILQRIQPKIAIVSVGAGNDYGHPTREALDRLEAVNAHVYRTDLDGDIVVTSDGSRLRVKTEKGAVQENDIAGTNEPAKGAAPGKPRHDERGQKASAPKVKPAVASPEHVDPIPAVHVEPRPSAAAAPAKSAGGYVASAKSEVFHVPGCVNAAKIKPENFITFQTRDEAVNSGRRPAKDCNP